MDDIRQEWFGNIKNDLLISFKNRPFWDIEFLTSLGFECSCDYTNINDKLHGSKDKFCNPTKMFALYCIK